MLIRSFLLLSVTVNVCFSQSDSSMNKYGHLGNSIGSGICHSDLSKLLAEGFMLGMPEDLNFLPICGSFYIGQPGKFFGSFEFSWFSKNKQGPYTNGFASYDNITVDFSKFRWGINLYRNIHFSKHFAFDINAGSSLCTGFVSSVYKFNNQNASQIFISGKYKQDGSVYAGTMFRFFWPTKSADLGFVLKLGYHIPTSKAKWYSAFPVWQPIPEISLSGPVAELALYSWTYSRAYVMKHLLRYQAPQTTNDSTPNALDSTKSLFKTPKFSYMQWDLGYNGMMLKGEWKNCFDASFLGFVFGKKYATSIGVTGFVDNSIYAAGATAPPKVDSYVAIYWNNEFLLNPDRLVNFSFPVRVSFAGATSWDTVLTGSPGQVISNWNFSGLNYYQHYGDMWTVSPGANIFLNVFKSVSIGAGANYRFAFGVTKEIGTDRDFSNYSILAFLRLKLDTRAMRKKGL